MGCDEAALLRLWREKRGDVEPEDLSGNLLVQLGSVTEDLNRRWYELNSRQVIVDIQRLVRHPAVRWMAATLDGRVEASGAVFEAKFMLPWSFSEEAAAEKYTPQLQHNMWVVAAKSAVLSVITGGGKWVEIAAHADPLYQHLIVTAERKFWRCVERGEPRGSYTPITDAKADDWRGGFGQGAIEVHPSRRDLALHNFQCADCGPVKTKIISLTPKTDLRPGD